MKRIALTYNGQSVVSDHFNFKTYRTMYTEMVDALEHGTFLPPDLLGYKGLIALFDGTVLTEDVFDRYRVTQKGLDAVEVISSCEKLAEWYHGLKRPKNNKQTIGEVEDPIMRLFYLMLSKGIPPSQIDAEDPQLLMDALAASEDGVTNVDDIPPEMRIYYGL